VAFQLEEVDYCYAYKVERHALIVEEKDEEIRLHRVWLETSGV